MRLGDLEDISYLARNLLMPERSNTNPPQPAVMRLKSTDNLPVESMWSYWLKWMGDNIKLFIQAGPKAGWCM